MSNGQNDFDSKYGNRILRNLVVGLIVAAVGYVFGPPIFFGLTNSAFRSNPTWSNFFEVAMRVDTLKYFWLVFGVGAFLFACSVFLFNKP